MASFELCRHMEKALLDDASITQAKIVDLAPAGAAKHDFVVAVNITPTADQAAAGIVSDDLLLKASRKALVRKMHLFGGKDVVPRKWTRQPSLPVRPDHTVDEDALRKSLMQDDTVRKAAPVTLDSKIFGVVAMVLGVPESKLSYDQTFFQNGGDSFSAIQVTSCLMKEGISLRVPDIVWAETLAELPTRVLSRHPGLAPAPRPAAAPTLAVDATPAAVTAIRV